MSKISPEQMLGNWGEQYVAERLALANCLVRHVPEGRDSGIDLYCESIVKESPFLHFWVQVKTGRTCMSWVQNGYVNESHFGKEKMDYWLKQVIPVVIVLVPPIEMKDENVVFLCPVIGEKSRLKVIMAGPGESIFSEFIADELSYLTYLWNLKDGKLAPLPSPEPGYVANFPVSMSFIYEKKIRQTLHHTLWRLSEDILHYSVDFETLHEKPDAAFRGDDLLRKVRPYVRTLEAFMQFAGIGNYENHVTIGIVEELEGNASAAADRYEKALVSIKGDQKFMAAPGTDAIVAKITRHLARARQPKS